MCILKVKNELNIINIEQGKHRFHGWEECRKYPAGLEIPGKFSKNTEKHFKCGKIEKIRPLLLQQL